MPGREMAAMKPSQAAGGTISIPHGPRGRQLFVESAQPLCSGRIGAIQSADESAARHAASHRHAILPRRELMRGIAGVEKPMDDGGRIGRMGAPK